MNKQALIDSLVDLFGVSNFEAKRSVRQLIMMDGVHTHTMGGCEKLYYGKHDPVSKIANPGVKPKRLYF